MIISCLILIGFYVTVIKLARDAYNLTIRSEYDDALRTSETSLGLLETMKTRTW